MEKEKKTKETFHRKAPTYVDIAKSVRIDLCLKS